MIAHRDPSTGCRNLGIGLTVGVTVGATGTYLFLHQGALSRLSCELVLWAQPEAAVQVRTGSPALQCAPSQLCCRQAQLVSHAQ